MNFEGVIYFLGPKTQWSGQIDEQEVIARVNSKFQWLARWLTRSAYAHLDQSRCGYAVIGNGILIEHVEAKNL